MRIHQGSVEWSQVQVVKYIQYCTCTCIKKKDKMEGFEEDPAAAFLAREQNELADIAADTLGNGVRLRVLCKAIKAKVEYYC